MYIIGKHSRRIRRKYRTIIILRPRPSFQTPSPKINRILAPILHEPRHKRLKDRRQQRVIVWAPPRAPQVFPPGTIKTLQPLMVSHHSDRNTKQGTPQVFIPEGHEQIWRTIYPLQPLEITNRHHRIRERKQGIPRLIRIPGPIVPGKVRPTLRPPLYDGKRKKRKRNTRQGEVRFIAPPRATQTFNLRVIRMMIPLQKTDEHHRRRNRRQRVGFMTLYHTGLFVPVQQLFNSYIPTYRPRRR